MSNDERDWELGERTGTVWNYVSKFGRVEVLEREHGWEIVGKPRDEGGRDEPGPGAFTAQVARCPADREPHRPAPGDVGHEVAVLRLARKLLKTYGQ